MLTAQSEDVTFGAAWVKLTGSRAATFESVSLDSPRGVSVTDSSMFRPADRPEGAGIGFPFPPTRYPYYEVPESAWQRRVTSGSTFEPGTADYPVTVALRLDPTTDHGTAEGMVVHYSVGPARRTVFVATRLLVVSRAVYPDCNHARDTLGLTGF